MNCCNCKHWNFINNVRGFDWGRCDNKLVAESTSMNPNDYKATSLEVLMESGKLDHKDCLSLSESISNISESRTNHNFGCIFFEQK